MTYLETFGQLGALLSNAESKTETSVTKEKGILAGSLGKTTFFRIFFKAMPNITFNRKELSALSVNVTFFLRWRRV